VNRTATIAGLGVALPPSAAQDELWSGYFAQHYTGGKRTLAERIFANSGVRTRQAAVSPLLEDVSGWSTERRMRRYQVEAAPLGKEAVGRALTDAGIAADELGLFAVCSCTGYATPGLDILLARDMGMSATVQRLFVGHMGCYAALPGLGSAADFVVARERPAMLLCAELTSLHVQPPNTRADIQQIVSHALFADAAAAVVLTPGERTPGYAVSELAAVTDTTAAVVLTPGERTPGYAVSEVAAVTDTTTADHMTWEVTDLGFRMGLSPLVPKVLARHVRTLVDGLLARHGLMIGEVDGWAVHPGGPKILDVVQEQLGLGADDLAASRGVLSAYGNCSSPTVLLVLDALRRRPVPPRRVVLLAFGPGLTLYVALLERPTVQG
jgi:predicted naringenin-chalcone synthase